MTRVIHTGDTHIGYQQYHSPERRQDFLDAFEQVVTDAISEEVAAVIHAGDLFHDRRPDLQDLLGTISTLRRLEEAGIPFLAVVGNHESTRGGQWLDLFERLGLATRLGDEPVVVDDVAVYGLDHVPKSRRDDLAYEFADHDAAFAALVGHGLFSPVAAHGDWDAEEVLTEASVGFDAMLLGDDHTPDTQAVAGAWVTYCGSTERTAADQEAGRGYNVVEFDPERAGDGTDGEGEDGDDEAAAPAGVEIRRRALETRPFAFVSVDLAEGEGVERVREQVRQHDLEDAVAIVEITGEGDPVTVADVEEFALERGALVARVTDRREMDTETDISVSFADPDAAVRERVGELGLSAAALDVDETVRASKVADANVRQEVKGRVRDLLDDPDAFEAADVGDDGTDGQAAEDEGTTADADDAPGDADDTSGDVDDPSGDADETPADGEAPSENVADATADGDGQSSMEDYL
ncbi:MAG: DNA double-strand break repair protein Mre11 [Haloferacaceae archaeon]